MLTTLVILVAGVLFGGMVLWWYPPTFLHTFNLAELIPDALLIIDNEGKIVFANENSEILLGYTKFELYSMTVEDLMPERFRESHKQRRSNFNMKPGVKPMGMGREFLILHKNGNEIPTEIALSPASQSYMSKYCRQKVIALLSDVTKRKEYESKIHNLAYFDQLTNLPNRTSFYKDEKDIVNSANENKNALAFILLDIRELKKINDTMGHFTGDEVIKQIGIRLCNYVQSYQNKVYLYNISGNEFLFIIEYAETDNSKYIETLATEIIFLFRTPLFVRHNASNAHDNIKINVNLGISLFPIHGKGSSQLLKAADIALIESKGHGPDSYVFYNSDLNSEFNTAILYEDAIKYFIKTNDFDIHYQPVWDVKRQKHIGLEALFHCNENLYPNMNVDFLINVAESTGLINDLGSAILTRVCKEINKYGLLDNNDLIISINASMRQLQDNKFPAKINNIIRTHKIPPKNLAIEITETVLMNRDAQVIEKVEMMRKTGIKIYIDDFGKGYSSLSYLKNIPADKLKIDILFVKGLEQDTEIMHSIIKLGHAMKLIVCVEGIETESEMDIVTNLGSDEVQGFYNSVPIPAYKLKETYPDMFK